MPVAAAAQASWADCVRDKLGLAADADFDALPEPQRTWARYMLSAVERGRGVMGVLAAHGWQPGLRFLDAGCAYGGYLVAAAQAGAREVVGLDIDPDYLGLAERLLAAHGVAGTLVLGNIDDPRVHADLCGAEGFDVVTCTDVLEHVPDPAVTLGMLARYLAPGGRAYVTIPNCRHPAWVRADPHFGIAGITLLPPAAARATAYAVHPWLPRYSVGEYHPLAWYRERLHALGLTTWLLNPPGGTLPELAGGLRQAARELAGGVDALLASGLPEPLATALRAAIAAWARQLLEDLPEGHCRPDVVDEYAVQTWELLVVR